jgi:hypothetical protein
MESKLTPRFYTRTGSTQAGKRILPWRMVKATLEKPVTSWAGSAERTTMSPSMPFFGNAAGTDGISDAFGGISGERG